MNRSFPDDPIREREFKTGDHFIPAKSRMQRFSVPVDPPTA